MIKTADGITSGFILLTVNGGYSSWGPYGDCSKSCGGGEQSRKRTCTNPPPANGGKDCSSLGPNTSSRNCNEKNCPSECVSELVIVLIMINSHA